MNIAVLYLDGYKLKSTYPEDCEGRDGSVTMHPVVGALKRLGHNVQLVEADLDSFEKLRSSKPDVVFNLCDDGFHAKAELEPHVAAMLDILEIPYTGCGPGALSICLDKANTKRILAHEGLPTPDFYVAESPDDIEHNLEYPVIVKPLGEDGSIGIKKDSVVDNDKDLSVQIKKLVSLYKEPALVEKFIDGREFNIALLGNGSPVALPVSEIVFEGLHGTERIVSYDAKWKESSKQYKSTVRHCPADITPQLRKELIDVSTRAYKLMGLRGYGRVDIRANGNGPQILEVNPNPDISADAGLTYAAKAAGITYEQLVEKIINYALEDQT